MTNKQALTVEAINQAFAGTNFGRDDLKNILAETVIDAAAGWRCGYTATTICTQLGLLTPKGRASALGLRFISEHVQRETKRLKDELEAAEKRIAELMVPTPELKMAHLINKFYERYPLEEFKSDTERSAALGYFMAGAELQCFGEFINYAELMGDE
ncbi:hypothetical protein ND373_000751 [Escherichia coli]|nr:hypothetical protein [Escherichia coli]EKL9721623.1 hypothetical protein [Escherichia coli]